MYHTDSSFHDTVLYPPKGYACQHHNDVTIWDKRFDGSGSVDFALTHMTQFLEQNQLTVEEIELFLFSQFSIKISIPLLNISIYPGKSSFLCTGSRIYRFFKSFSGFA